MTNGKKIVTAFAIGTAVGAVVGILFAHSSGKETRKNIHDKAKELEEEISGKWAEGRKRFEEAEDAIQKVLDDVETKAEVIKEKLKKYS